MRTYIRGLSSACSHKIQSGINGMIERSYGISEVRKRNLWLKFWGKINSFKNLLTNDRRSFIYILNGLSLADGQPLRAGLLGNFGWTLDDPNNTLYYFRMKLFQNAEATIENCGTCLFPQLRHYTESLAKEVDIILVESNAYSMWKPNRGSWRLGPAWVRMVIDFQKGQTWKEVEKQMNQHHNLSALRRAKLTFRLSQEDEDFHVFYHEMYLPLIQDRFKDCCYVESEDELLDVFHNKGSILQILDNDQQVVGGWLQTVYYGVLYDHVNGVRDGSQELVRKGVLSGCYYFGIRWGFENGLRRIDAGMCPPFSNDGVVVHKHRWGFKPCVDWWQPEQLLIWSPQSAEVALRWMRANPLMMEIAHHMEDSGI